LDDAVAQYQKALAINPNFAQAKQGKTLQEIIQRLNDLKHVYRDWSNNSADHPMNLPNDEPPEYWDSEALEKHIAKRKLEWLKEPDRSDGIWP
jgi:hypothetical protein